MIAITFDIDWVPDAIIADTLALLCTENGASPWKIAMHQPEYMNMGHVMGLVLSKI
jgi:hypothetical protein